MSQATNPKLLSNAAKLFRETIRRDPAGRKLAALLGLHDEQILERFQVGYSNGSLIRATPSRGAVREALCESGLLSSSGEEAMLGCLMVPTHSPQDEVLGFVAIPPQGEERALPSDLPTFRVTQEDPTGRALILVGSVLDALRFVQAGQKTVVPLGSLSDEARAFFGTYRPAKVYFAAEYPEALALMQKLEIPSFRLDVKFPATLEAVAAALEQAVPIVQKVAPDATVRVLDDRLLRFECAARKYEVHELAPNETDRLRVRVRAQGDAAFHLDTLDLYAGRSRAGFARLAAPSLGVPPEAIEGDLRIMIQKLEAIRTARRAQAGPRDGKYALTPDEEAEALAYLKQPNLLDRIAQDLEALGYIGEDANKKLGYLISISRKLASPLSGVIISRAAAGKSRLMEVLGELVPPEELVSYTRITPQALYYSQNRSLKNKLLISGEDEGLLGSDYALRELISSKKIRLATPLKDSETGKMTTVEYEVEGPIALLFSTTKPAIHYENATRCFILSLDESPDQTERIMRLQLARRTLNGVLQSIEGRDLRRLHRNAQRLVRPLLVVNPFSEVLKFSPRRIESRRDHDKYLSLIEAIALLNQHQREIKRLPNNGRELEYIEVTAEDVAEADRLMAQAVGDQDAELSGPSLKLIDLIQTMVAARARELEVEPKDVQFNRRDIREYTGWSDNQIKAHIKRLEELEYLAVRAGDRGRMYRYQLGSWQPVGDKLGAASPGDLPDKSKETRPTSWEVGRIPEKNIEAVAKGA